MKKLVLLLVLFTGFCRASDGVAAFDAGLKAFQANGADALLRAWYPDSDDPARIEAIRDKLAKTTRNLGEVVDTQVFAPYKLGKHVERLYGVIYFARRPLWIRAEYYSIGGHRGFISLEYSFSADDILPLAFAE
jgi:hypothetical protein